MIKKNIRTVASVLAGAALILGSAAAVQAEDTAQEVQPTVTGCSCVTARTYIGANGQMLDALVFSVQNEEQKKLTAEDFSIEMTIAPVDYLGETESKIQAAVIEGVTALAETVEVDLEDVAFSTLEDLKVSCSDELFSCGLGDFQIETKTVDDFTADTFTASDGTELSYYLYMPEGEEGLPLMVWEHGGGEVLASAAPGMNLKASRGAVAWVEAGFETAVLSVQYPENYSFGISEIPEELSQMDAFGTAKYELIQQLLKDGKIDENRIYISGASSGAGAALRMILQYPDLFAGALVMSAKDTIVPISQKYDLAYKFGDNSLLELTDEEYQETYDAMSQALADVDISNTPIWFVQAEHDQICTSYTSSMMYDILQQKGDTNKKLTLYTDEEMEAAGQHGAYHGCWAIALEDQEMLDWVYAQQKN